MTTPTIDAQTGEQSRRPVFQTSAEAVKLKRRLLEMQLGEEILTKEVEEIIGGKWERKAWVVSTAIRQARNEAQVVIERVRNTGWKRVDDSEIVEVTADHVIRAGRTARKGLSKAGCANPEKLSKEEKSTLYARATVLAVIGRVTETSKLKAIASKVNGAVLPFKEALLTLG